MHSCIIRRPTLGPNFKEKLKFTCIIHTYALRCNGAIKSELSTLLVTH